MPLPQNHYFKKRRTSQGDQEKKPTKIVKRTNFEPPKVLQRRSSHGGFNIEGVTTPRHNAIASYVRKQTKHQSSAKILAQSPNGQPEQNYFNKASSTKASVIQRPRKLSDQQTYAPTQAPVQSPYSSSLVTRSK